MTSTASRHTQTFTVPETQNTAPILDFRCLYTHDIRRKSKRWQDGLLRFHTFNKRVMVYDVPRNFIGDTHLHEHDAVQDGDELQLEKGVLIQVGEAVGSVDQDLTALFESRRKATNPSPAKAVSPQQSIHGTASSATGSLSQLRPKTLNSLLGTPKGPIGRATFPTKSPYEIRTQNVPLSKTPKVSSDRRALMPKPITNRSEKGHVEHDASTETRPTKRQRLSADTLQAVQRPSVTPKAHDRSKPLERVPILPVSGFSSPAPVSRTVIAIEVNDDEEMLLQQDVVPRNPLRLAARKPRKKLMYRDLLPQESIVQAKASIVTHKSSDVRPPAKKTPTPKPKLKRKPKDHLNDFHEEQQEKLQARLRKKKAKRTALVNKPEKDVFDLRSSPDLSDSREYEDPLLAGKDATKENPPEDRYDLSDDLFDQSSPKPAPWLKVAACLEQSPSDLLSPTHDLAFELNRMDELLLSRPLPKLLPTAKKSSSHTSALIVPQAARPVPDVAPPPPPTVAPRPKVTPIPPEADPPPPNVAPPPPRASFSPQTTLLVPEATLPPPNATLPAPKVTPIKPAPPAPNPALPTTNQTFNPPKQVATSPNTAQPPPHPLPPPTKSSLLPPDSPLAPPPFLQHPAPTHLSSSRRASAPLQKTLSESSTKPYKAPSKRPLQKATSDLSNLRTAPVAGVVAAPARVGVGERDLGPWSREAFDLFGWEGPGRGKEVGGGGEVVG